MDVGEHNTLGIVDRFICTLREKITKYMVMCNTTKYINVLSHLIHGYTTHIILVFTKLLIKSKKMMRK